MQKVITWLILVFSFFMFCYQAQIAINKYLNPPVIDSTEILNFEDSEPPLITVCPSNRIDEAKVTEFGYFSSTRMFMGIIDSGKSKGMIGWGTQLNLTFDQMIAEVMERMGRGFSD